MKKPQLPFLEQQAWLLEQELQICWLQVLAPQDGELQDITLPFALLATLYLSGTLQVVH
jgi:hypothetical protein